MSRVWAAALFTLSLHMTPLYGSEDSPSQTYTALDFKEGMVISGKRVVIERFIGTLTIKTHDEEAILAKAQGPDELLKDYEMNFDQNGKINWDWRPDRQKRDDQPQSLILTLTLPKTMPLELHLTKGEATLEPREGASHLIIEGEGKITATRLGEETKISINGAGDVTLIDMQGKGFEAEINGTGHIFVKEKESPPLASEPKPEKPRRYDPKDTTAPSHV